MGLNLVWFRNDLRVRDNPALWHGAQAGPVVAIYFITPDQWRSHAMAGCRVEFVLRSLRLLRKDLNALGIPLVVQQVPSFGLVAGQLQEFCRIHEVAQVFWNNEYPVDEVVRDAEVENSLRAGGVRVNRFHDRVIAPPGAVIKDDGSPYKVFTPFKRTWLRLLESGFPDIFPPPSPQLMPEIEQQQIPDSLPEFASHIDSSQWPAGENEAHDRLQQFAAQGLENYHRQRDLPAVNGTSTLSPYLAVGAVSPQQCLMEALLAPGGEGVDCWINELIWRDFYQHIVWHFPQVCRHQPFKGETAAIPWRNDQSDFAAWQQGKTGVPLVDAGMRQLLQTGWMHNRVRMVTAMFLSKNLLLDWRLGEQFFMAHLIDGDFPANNGGWQWSASTGTDAVPYFRIFNPFTQGQRFDPDAIYIKRYVPELQQLAAKDIHNPAKLQHNKPDSYPPVIVGAQLARERVLAAFR